MRFTLAQLETFYWISRLGSFRAASQRLNLAQPTISLRIRELESALGTPLFQRIGRRVRLTADGAALVGDAERLLGIAGSIDARARVGSPVRGLLRFGAPESFALVCLPGLVRLLEEAHPELNLEVTIETSSDLMAMLNERALDLAVLTNPDSDDRYLRTEALGRHEMAWIAPGALKFPTPVRPDDLTRCQIICNSRPSPMFRMVLGWFRSAGVEPLRFSFCNSLTMIARLTTDGVGVSMLPPAILAAELQAGTLQLLPSRPPIAKATMFATYHASNSSPPVSIVIDAIRNVLIATKFLLPLIDHPLRGQSVQN
jgi:DNA-binding transcriptional LysR family regulator